MDNRQILLTSSVVTITTVAVVLLWLKYKKQKIPTEWRQVGKVSDLHLYPLKSGHRVEVNEGKCTRFGLEQITDKAVYKLKDRFLVVYHGQHFEFRTARTHPKMVLIELSNHDVDHVALDAPNMRTLYVKIPHATDTNSFQITLHDKERTEIVDCGEEAASWLSRYILDSESGLRLGVHDENLRQRKINTKFLKFYPNIMDSDMGIFSDLSSFMLMNKTSMNDLNSRLNKEVSFCQFRPNIFVEGIDKPYIEDSWKWIKIGDEVVFQNVKPCTRCVFTTIDDKTGIFDSEREPLKTLKKYRQLPDEEERKANSNSPVMGINLGLRKPGIIKVNDVVYVG